MHLHHRRIFIGLFFLGAGQVGFTEFHNAHDQQENAKGKEDAAQKGAFLQCQPARDQYHADHGDAKQHDQSDQRIADPLWHLYALTQGDRSLRDQIHQQLKQQIHNELPLAIYRLATRLSRRFRLGIKSEGSLSKFFLNTLLK